MRKLAQKLREETEELEENIVDVRREDKTIRDFQIPVQDISETIGTINSIKVFYSRNHHEPLLKEVDVTLRKRTHMLISGPNGAGKSTFLRSLVAGTAEGVTLNPEVRVGYYSQDFSSLNYDETVFDSLQSVMVDSRDTQEMRSIAAGFLITGDLMGHKISELSEGQKGLLSFARLVLMRPGLLILDEPTNHINFRHIPIIAQAINEYEGCMILVSHMPDFVKQIRIDQYIDLDKV
jgi:ATP-binding cassette subfamily F protein 3